MEKTNVTQNAVEGCSDRYIQYLYDKLKKAPGASKTELELLREQRSSCLLCRGNESSLAQMRQIANEHLSDILVIGYKYEFFKRNLALPLLAKDDRSLLYSALVSADYKEDKRYVARRVGFCENCSIDGVYNFRLAELRARWREVIEYIPADFSKYELESFLDYIVGESDGKIYVKNGKVYDENYRELQRSELLGEQALIAEILLSGAGTVYCFGEIDAATKGFLRKYYKEKAVFC